MSDRTGNALLAQRSVEHAMLAELLLQTDGAAEDSTESNVFAKENGRIVGLHRNAHSIIDCSEKVHALRFQTSGVESLGHGNRLSRAADESVHQRHLGYYSSRKYLIYACWNKLRCCCRGSKLKSTNESESPRQLAGADGDRSGQGIRRDTLRETTAVGPSERHCDTIATRARCTMSTAKDPVPGRRNMIYSTRAMTAMATGSSQLCDPKSEQ